MPARTPHTLTQLAGSDTRCAALTASSRQPPHTPTADLIATAIRPALPRSGPQGCTERMAQEFGYHPEAASPKARAAPHPAHPASLTSITETFGSSPTGLPDDQ